MKINGGGAEITRNVSSVDISLCSNNKCNFILNDQKKTPRRYSYFDVVMGLVWSNDPQSYAGCSVATGRASHATQVKSDDPHNKGYPGAHVGGWVWG